MPPNECRISQPYGEAELATLTTGELGLPAPMHQMFRHYSQASQIGSRLNRPSMLDIIFFYILHILHSVSVIILKVGLG